MVCHDCNTSRVRRCWPLKCHYDENRIFSIKAILKLKPVACMRRKMLFTIFKYLILFQRYSSFQNMQISQVMMSYTQPNFDQIWWKKDISANLCQKCLILCSKILRNVLRNLSLTVLLPWQHTGSHIKGISGHLWPCLTFSELRITYVRIEIKWVGTGNERVAMGTKCFIALGVFSVELFAC